MTNSTKHASVNGTEIHYVEAGNGPPLLLLQSGLMSTDAVWQGHPSSYLSHLDAFASRFRVIVPDARGLGRTRNPGGGSVSYAQLAEDLVALASALALERPLVCGFSDGGTIATVAAARSPSTFRAVVNHAGFDLLNPQSKAFGMARMVFGGAPDATSANPAAAEAFFSSKGPAMADFMRRLQADHGAQGPDGWKSALAQSFERLTSSPGIGIDDLRNITTPMLVLTGDRDMLCPPEDAVVVYRALSGGELAITPGLGHEVSTAAVASTLEFLQRRML